MARLAIAPMARADLRDIRRYSEATFGHHVALIYLTGLRGAFEILLQHPATGRTEHDLGDGVRSLSYRSHRIYYRMLVDEIRIVRVLHQARDVGRAFGEPT